MESMKPVSNIFKEQNPKRMHFFAKDSFHVSWGLFHNLLYFTMSDIEKYSGA